MFKKWLSVAVASFTILLSVSPVAFAAEDQFNVNFDTAKGQGNKSKPQLIAQYQLDGLSSRDAEYYAKLDILVAEIERSNKKIKFDDNVQALSEEYISTHPDDYRNKLLALDKSAWKAAMMSNSAVFLSNNDYERAQKSVKDLTVNGKKVGSQYTIVYPDGSTAIFGSSTVRSNETASLTPNTSVDGPWTVDTLFNSDVISSPRPEGDYTTRSTWQYFAGVSYAKIEDVFKWTHSHNGSTFYADFTATFKSDTGASSYSGIVTVDNETLSNNQGTVSTGILGTRIQGYTDIRFKVSGSFDANFGVLSISVAAGVGWHQYAITEVAGSGDTFSYAGQFI